jgi:hypothetical protein
LQKEPVLQSDDMPENNVFSENERQTEPLSAWVRGLAIKERPAHGAGELVRDDDLDYVSYLIDKYK